MKLDILARSDGLSLMPVTQIDRNKVAKLRGRALRWKACEPRNPRRHAKFFAALHEAFVQWPEAVEFQPVDAEHLRAWLLCEAGHCDVMELRVAAREVAAARLALESTMSFADVKHIFVAVSTSGRLQVRRPRSMAFNAMPETIMRPLINRVFDHLRALGLDPDRLAHEHGRAA